MPVLEGSKMDIDQGRLQGLVSHEIFDGKQVGPVFIKVSSKGMPERMAGEPVFPAEKFFMGTQMSCNVKGIDGTGRVRLFREKPAGGTAACKPVAGEKIKSFLGKDCIAVGAAFGARNMDPHRFALNITVTEITDFADPEAGRIHECNHRFGFWIRQGGDKSMDFLFGRDKGKIGIEFPDRKLCWIPWFMKHVDGEEPELGDTGIDGTVGKGPILLKPADKIPEFIPGDLLRQLVKNRVKVIQIRTDISRIRS